ncbi:MAG: sensor histidine kinase [Armatimonadota bacterium]
MSKGLCPLDPDPGALPPALKALAKRVQKAIGIQCSLVVSGDVSIHDPIIAQHLYRIAQEAVSNSSRHAKASHIVMELQRCDNDLLLWIEDDGIGIPAQFPSRGMGLHTMAYRAQVLDGTINITRGANGGTSVLCRVPCINNFISDEQIQNNIAETLNETR